MNTALIIPIYNRPEYVKQCFESLSELTQLPDIIVLINDCSTDEEANKLFNEFTCKTLLIKLVNPKNIGIKANLKMGFSMAFLLGCDIVINLDSDAIVKRNFIERLIELKKQFPDHIVSGFNSKNTNKDGSLRNPIIEEHPDYILKKHCNGINMCMDRQLYQKYVLPALECDGNWDFNSTHDKSCVIAKPSVVQHIGLISSMGHNDNPDVACDFKQLSLPNVTLLGIDYKNPIGIKRAADISQEYIEFGAVKIITDVPIDGRDKYSEWCIKEMTNYIETSHVLVIHADGYILNWQAWEDEFLQYDYIGATWWYKDNMNVGNGGFSLRSKKLQDILASDDNINQYHPEDDMICRKYRPYLEQQYGIKFAPEEVANRFAIEGYNSPDNAYKGQFGFHGWSVDFSRSGVPAHLLPTRPVQFPNPVVPQSRPANQKRGSYALNQNSRRR